MIDLAGASMHVLEQVGHDRPLRLDESALVGERVCSSEGASLVEAEVLRAPALDGETAHGDAVDDSLPRGELVLPGPVVARRRRRDLDVEVRREALDERAGVRLGTATADLAVALHDDHEARRRHAAVSATSCARRASNASHDDSRSTHARPAAPSAARAAMARSSDGPNSAASRYAMPPPERATWPAVAGVPAG